MMRITFYHLSKVNIDSPSQLTVPVPATSVHSSASFLCLVWLWTVRIDSHPLDQRDMFEARSGMLLHIFVWVTSYQSGCVACWRAPTGTQRQQGTSRDIKGRMSKDQGVFTFSAKVPKCNSVWPALRLGSKVRPIATLALRMMRPENNPLL